MAFTATQQRKLTRRWAKKAFQHTGRTADIGSDNIDAMFAALGVAIDDNIVTLNNFIPEPAKSSLSGQEKGAAWANAFLEYAGLI